MVSLLPCFLAFCCVLNKGQGAEQNHDPPSVPGGIVFVADDCSVSGFPFGFHHGASRAYTQYDLPTPSLMGRKLCILRPGRPGVEPRVLVDAGGGALGSPSVSFDGKWILFAMAPEGEDFWHLYRVSPEGGTPQRLTHGPFHDLDPAELPDGRIVFTSTRIGSFEEYHSAPSRALFTMHADGSHIRPLTYTVLFDNDPRVLPDGRIGIARIDNFFDRAKVEGQIHAIHPDGTSGLTEVGAQLGPKHTKRLRGFGYGSLAPLPDGRWAYLGTRQCITRPGEFGTGRNLPLPTAQLVDLSPLPDGRLLCTLSHSRMIDGKNRMVRDTIAVFTPGDKEPARLYQADKGSLHSPVCLAPRPRPPLLADTVQRTDDGEEAKTGRVFCQNVFITQKTQADWQRVRAARLLGGLPPTLRSQRSSVVHIGIEVVELGTVPLAPDGSFYVEVPANMPLAVQLVDGEGRPEINQTSWFYVRPGETRSCIGCHHRPQSVSRSSSAFPQALRTPPLKLLGQGDAHRFRGNNPAVNGMTDVQFDRFREVGSLDLHSRSSGAENGVGGWAREIARLVQQLQGPREDLRISATQRLAIFRDRSVAPELAKCLRGRSRELRVAAALALGTCGTRESVEPLLEVLDDGDPLVVQAATVSLENLTGHKEPDRAFDTAAGRKETAAAWRAWRKANSWDAIEKSLVGDLASTDRVTKRRAVVALGHIGSAAARAALRQLVAEQIAQPSPYPKGLVLDAISFDAASPLNPRTLQEALRSLGYLRDREAVAILGEVIAWGAPTLDTSKGMSGMFAPPARETVLHLHAVEAALQALGRIATPEAEAVVIDNLCRFAEHVYYLGWYGDDGALFACHAAPIFHRALEAMDAMGSKRCGEVVSRAVRSLPTDVDRMLFMEPDSYETLVGRLVESSGQADAIIETCLAVLGDPDAKIVEQWTRDVTDNHGAMAGKLGRESRAAHVLSVVCVDRRYEPRVRAVFDRYRKGETIVKGNQPRSPKAGLPNASATRSWVCFFMARTLARLGDPASFPALLDALNGDPPEAAWGRPKPWLHGVQWLHNEYTPCYRAAAAFALGRLGDKRAVPVLLNVASDLDMNSLDTRYAAIKALERIADPQSLSPLRELAKDYPEVSTRRAMRRACAVLSGESPLTPLD